MSNITNKQPIKVGILEISSQNRAILEFFFSGAGKSYFKEVSLDKASAYIIDYDSLGAKESWESTFEETKKPGIIISIKEVDLPSTIWLQKPLTVKALKNAGESIREMMLNEVSPELVATIIEERTEETIEKIIEPQKVAVAQIDELPTEEVIDIPSEPISQIAPKEEPLDELENIIVLQENKKEDALQEEALEFDDNLISLIEETAETPEESLPTIEVTGEQTVKTNSLISEKEEPELAVADTKDSASSSKFAASSNFIDIDLNLNDIDESLDEDAIQKSSTTPIDTTGDVSSNEKSEIDSLLETLISGGKSKEKADKPIIDIVDNKADLLDFDLETAEVETIKTANDLPKPAITNTRVIEDDGSSLGLEDNDLEDSESGLPDELITTLDSLEIIKTIDDKEINKILHGKSKTEEPKKTAEEELQSLLEEIRKEAKGTAEVAETASSQVIQKYTPTNAEERWELTCGDNNTIDLQKIRMFNPSNHLLAPLIQNVKTAKQSKIVLRMKFNGIIVVIDPETDRIFCDQSISTEFYANVCYEPISQEKIKTHQLDKSEIRLYRKKMKENAELTHYIEAFVWTSSLLSSRGRLPKNTNIKTKVGLTSWPDLTRVENIPHMMQIAALFHKNTWSLLEITSKLDIQKNYVVAFYNAALALDMIETGGEVVNSTPLDLKTGDNKNRSFLSRLLKKITA